MDNKGNNEVKNKTWNKKLSSEKYSKNICLRLEEWGKELLKKDKIIPDDIRERAKKLGDEIEKNEIFEFDFGNINDQK